MIENYWPGALSENEVHIWHLVEDDALQEIHNDEECISAVEQEKVNIIKI